jgi:hypothetical protein
VCVPYSVEDDAIVDQTEEGSCIAKDVKQRRGKCASLQPAKATTNKNANLKQNTSLSSLSSF